MCSVEITTDAFCLTKCHLSILIHPWRDKRKWRIISQVFSFGKLSHNKVRFVTDMKEYVMCLKPDRRAFVPQVPKSSLAVDWFSNSRFLYFPFPFVTPDPFWLDRIKNIPMKEWSLLPPSSSYCLFSLSVGAKRCRSHSSLGPFEVSSIQSGWHLFIMGSVYLPVYTRICEWLSPLLQLATPIYQGGGGGGVCVCVSVWPYSCITQSPQLEKCYHSSTGRWKSKKSGQVGKRERAIRGQWGMRESEWHQRHGFPPVHLSTQNKQASH